MGVTDDVEPIGQGPSVIYFVCGVDRHSSSLIKIHQMHVTMEIIKVRWGDLLNVIIGTPKVKLF